MKIKLSAFLKLSLAFFAVALFLVSCVKNDNLDYDTKVRFFNTVDGRTQDFYLNGVKVAPSIGYGTNSSYITAFGDKEYNIFAKDAVTNAVSDSIKYALGVGKNYSVYYTKTSATDSVLNVLEDNLTRDTSKVRIQFINLGYTLTSKVNIRNLSSSFTASLGYGEKTDYILLPVNESSKIYLNLVNTPSVIDSILPTNFVKGTTYTVLIDGVNRGTNAGQLKQRLIVNSN